MYKIDYHNTERKSVGFLDLGFDAHPRISKEFLLPMTKSKDKKCPDLFVSKEDTMSDMSDSAPYFKNHAAFENKFGEDLKDFIKLLDELTRMKEKYPIIPCYLIIVQEWRQEVEWVKPITPIYDKHGNRIKNPIRISVLKPVISQIDLARANSIAQNLNIRAYYVNHSNRFADLVIGLIRKPPKEIDLGQRFVTKSTGSEWNQALQRYPWVNANRADLIENKYPSMHDFIIAKNIYWHSNNSNDFMDNMKEIFTTEQKSKGKMIRVFHKTRLENFLKKIEGKE